jgi:putative intracellular protease/amidase
MATHTLSILIFDDVEVLDFCGPFEVFSVANRFTDPSAFIVLTGAEKPGPVVTRGSLSVNPHHRLADCPDSDLVLVPGGQGTRKGMHHTALIDWIRQVSSYAELVLSVCTGRCCWQRPGCSTTWRRPRTTAPSTCCARRLPGRRFTPIAASWTTGGSSVRVGSLRGST